MNTESSQVSALWSRVVTTVALGCALLAPCAQGAGGESAALVLRYDFEESGGAKVVDSSGRGFDGVYVNQPAWAAGVSGRAFKMAGGEPGSPSAPYVRLPGGVFKGLEAVTVATWVKWEGDGAWQWLYGLGFDADHYLFATPRSGAGALFSAIKSGGGEQGLHRPDALENGKWRHLAVTINSAARKSVLYVDGAVVAENGNVTITPSSLHEAGRDASGFIGKSFFPDLYFRGEVDDFRIYSTALSAAQVGNVYGAGMPAADAVALVKSTLNIGRAVVLGDLALPAGGYGASIKWASSQPEIIGANGAVRHPAQGRPVAEVVLTATISKAGVTAAKTFVMNVPPAGYALNFESHNPILKRDAEGRQLFTADPAVLVDGDTLYVYAGRDEAAIGGWFNMNEWVCYSTKDMVNWKYEGVVIKATDFSWGAPGTAWACQVVKRNGKYYFFSTTGRPDQKGLTVGVAVSDRATGPFVDAKNGPLFDNAITTGFPVDSMEDIDPTVFVDDDGQGYLYWGNSKLHYALLNDDLLSLKDLDGDGKITEGVDVFTQVQIQNMDGQFGEAPWLHKRNGKYYLTYASGLPQKVRYAMSDSPRGPWEYKGVILDENLRPDGGRGDYNSDTSHPAVVDFKGRSYVFYHNAGLPTGGQTRRSVCVENMTYNADGTIARSFITSTGLTGVAYRIQSASGADAFARFANFDAKVERDDGTATSAFQWEFILGLADEATVDTVSIQAVAHPGYYLTVQGGAVVLAKNDGSAEFKRSATFRRVPGLADANLVSFQSFAYPTLYLRQSEGAGKLLAATYSPDRGPAEKRDATFKLIKSGDAR